MEDFFAAGLDVAVILTPNNTHADIAVECMRHGLHVLATKPWALSTTQADHMINASIQYNRYLMEFLPMLWEEDLRLIRQEINRGSIGRVYHIRRCECSFGRRNDWQTQTVYGGGYLNNWGPHLIGQAMALADSPIASVYGYTRKLINPGDAEDMFYTALKTADGTLINVEYAVMERCMPRWVVQGTKGTVHITGDIMTVHTVSQPDTISANAYRDTFTVNTREVPFTRIDRSVIYDDVALTLDGDKAYPVAVSFSRQLTRVIEAVHTAALTNQLQVL